MLAKEIRLLTFAGFIRGLSAAALESQYFDEFVNLSKHLKDVTIVTAEAENIDNLPANLSVEQVPVSKTPKIRGLTKLLYFGLSPLRHRKKINLVYVRTMSPPEVLSFWLAKCLLKLPCVLLVGGTCFYEPITFKNRIYRWIYSKALASSDVVVVYSRLMIPYVRKVNGTISDSKFEVVHNAVDAKRFCKMPRDNELAEKLGIVGKKVLLFIGKINERKGVIDFVHTVSKAKTQDIVGLLIGSYDDKSEFDKIKKEIRACNVEDRIRFLGKVPNNELVRYMGCSDLFVYLTKACEGIPRAILESMASGMPVISTNVAGIPEAVIDNETGYIAIDSSDAASKVDLLLNDKEQYGRISSNCREKIESEFTYDVTLPKLVKIFESVSGKQNVGTK